MSWVGMFPGQGSQEPGMGKELLEKYPELLIDVFDDALGWSLESVLVKVTQNQLRELILLNHIYLQYHTATA